MRVLLLIVVLITLSGVAVWAKTYSCRDSSGQLHFSDNLQGLPEECLGQEKVVKPGTPDNLQYVPATPQPRGSGSDFNRSVRAAEREVEEKEVQLQVMLSRAEKLLERYRMAVAEKHQAKRRWAYSSRERIKQANAEIARVRAEKQQLLVELEAVRVSTRKKETTRKVLAEIDEE